MKEQFPNAKWVVWFREPKERVISHYNYWKSNEQKNEAYKYFNKNIGSFKEFVLSNELRKQVCMQETFLRKVELSNFDFVGDLENYESDIIRFGQDFDIEIPKQKRLNQSEKSQKESYQFTPEMLKVIAGEIDIYNQIKDLNKV